MGQVQGKDIEFGGGFGVGEEGGFNGSIQMGTLMEGTYPL